MSQGSPLGFRVKSFPSALGELVSERQQLWVVVRWSGRIVEEWDSLREGILFCRRPAWRQRAAGTEW